MNAHDNSQELISAIMIRADALARRTGTTPSEGNLDSEDAELLAMLADGSVSLERISDEVLLRWYGALGIDGIIDLLSPDEVSDLRASDSIGNEDQALTLRIRTNSEPMNAAEEQPMKSTTTSWFLRPSMWGAMAAVLAVAIAVFWGVRSLRPDAVGTDPGQFAFYWSPDMKIDVSSTKLWNIGRYPVAQRLPDWSRQDSLTMGASSNAAKYQSWQLGTVIVSTELGHGSGVFISPEGWLLTNYHVVETAVQEAALQGGHAQAEVITCHKDENWIRRRAGALVADVYRVAPSLDLALLKLRELPAGVEQMPWIKLAEQPFVGEDCFAVGSQGGGPAWAIRAGNIGSVFLFPDELTSMIVQGSNPQAIDVERFHGRVVATDCTICPGDSGGPLINADGELVGLTFATQANLGVGSTGYHIAVNHIREFVGDDLPAQPEPAPFDIWNAGVCGVTLTEPQFEDASGDGHADALAFQYAQQVGGSDSDMESVAAAFYLDLQQRKQVIDQGSEDVQGRIPVGLWGMESQGAFRFDVVVVARADGTRAFGYANAKGIVDEIRIDKDEDDCPDVVWQRCPVGLWHAAESSSYSSMLDASRLSDSGTRLLKRIFSDGSKSRQGDPDSPAKGKRNTPNKM